MEAWDSVVERLAEVRAGNTNRPRGLNSAKSESCANGASYVRSESDVLR